MFDTKLTADELTIINLIRKSPAYCDIQIEKRPTKDNPDGELSRVRRNDSTLLKDLIIIETPIVDK